METKELEYVDVVRRFRPVEDTPNQRWLPKPHEITWDEVLATGSPGIIIEAPSGAGKSAEFQNQTEVLRRSGKRAIYIEARSAASDGAKNSLRAADSRAYEDWLLTDESLTVFVDAVDEIALVSRSLRDLIAKLERDFDSGVGKWVTFVFGAKTGTLLKAEKGALREFVKRFAPGEQAADIKEFALEPLDIEGAKCLFSTIVSDTERAMSALLEEEILDLAPIYPIEAMMVAKYWSRHGRMPNLSELLTDIVELVAFANQRETLTAKQVSQGLKRLGAAALLGQQAHISTLPLAPVDMMSSQKLFGDWTPAHLIQLLQSRAMIPKGSSAVQLHQGALSQFLAAQWLSERTGLTAGVLLDCLTVRFPGEALRRIPRAMRQVIGWAASMIPQLRSLLVDEYPGLILFEGDPSKLSDTEILKCLKLLHARSASGQDIEVPIRGSFKRLGRPALESSVLELLAASKDATFRQLLLQISESAVYESVAEFAVGVAIDSGQDLISRTCAIRLLVKIDKTQHLNELLRLVSVETRDWVRSELLSSLAFKHLTGESLVNFVAAGGGFYFVAALRKVCGRFSRETMEAILLKIMPKIEENVDGCFAVAFAVLVAYLKSKDQASDIALEALRVVEGLPAARDRLNRDDAQDLDVWFSTHENDRRRLWMRRISENEQVAFDPPFVPLQPTDARWLLDQESAGSQIHLTRMIDLMSQDNRAALRDAADPTLAAFIDKRMDFYADRTAQGEARRQSDAKQDESTRNKNINALKAKADAIRAGNDGQTLLWAWRHLRPNGSVDHRRIDVDKLAKLTGPELAKDFVAGLQNYWRNDKVEIREPGNASRPLLYYVGLTGVSLEFVDGYDFSKLTNEEAELAARYAMYELNRLPVWLEPLVASHAVAVERILQATVEREWNYEKECNGILRFGRTASPRLLTLFKGVVLSLFAKSVPAHPRSIHYAIDVITAMFVYDRATADRLRDLVTSAQSEDVGNEWLRGWAHFDPAEAAGWLTRITDPEVRERRVVSVAALLEDDIEPEWGTPVSSAMLSVPALRRWGHLLYETMPPEQDVTHEGVYSPGPRDDAQKLRDRLILRLVQFPTLEAAEALRELRDRGLSATPWFEQCIKQNEQLRVDALCKPWNEEDILRVEAGDEKRPRTLHEFFELVQRHLKDVGGLLENDDFSYRSLFTTKTNEKQIQLWVASCLRVRAMNLYQVVRENAVDDDKQVDISTVVPGIGRIPIEIKPCSKYSVKQLKDCIDNQLVGKYMLPPDVDRGILLLVRHGERTWGLDGATLNLAGLVQHLNAYAACQYGRTGKLVSVVAIDTVSLPVSSNGG